MKESRKRRGGPAAEPTYGLAAGRGGEKCDALRYVGSKARSRRKQARRWSLVHRPNQEGEPTRWASVEGRVCRTPMISARRAYSALHCTTRTNQPYLMAGACPMTPRQRELPAQRCQRVALPEIQT